MLLGISSMFDCERKRRHVGRKLRRWLAASESADSMNGSVDEGWRRSESVVNRLSVVSDPDC